MPRTGSASIWARRISHGEAKILPLEVKKYDGKVPFHDITAVGPNMDKNLNLLDDAVKASNLSPTDKALVRDAIAVKRVEIELRLAPGTELEKGAAERLSKTATLGRDLEMARGQIDHLIAEQKLTKVDLEAFERAKDRFVEARAALTKVDAATKAEFLGAEAQLQDTFDSLKAKGLVLEPPIPVTTTAFDASHMKQSPAYVDHRAKVKVVDQLPSRIGEKTKVVVPKPGGS